MTDAAVDKVIDDLVSGSRILVRHNVLDAFGHVSARHPSRPDRFFMSKRVAPGLVTAEDFLEFDLSGELVEASGTPVFVERYIHSEIYRRRPDVGSVVHSHSNSMITVGVVEGITLKPVCHMCGFIGKGAPVFEIRETAGDASNLLVSTPTLGEALATKLDQANVVLMRGHGSTAVGPSVELAVYRAVYAETNARIQTAAMLLGPINALTPGEADATDEMNAVHVGRSWDFWKSEL